MKKARFASLLALCAIIAAVFFIAGRATVQMDETRRPTADHAPSDAPASSPQAESEKHDSNGPQPAVQTAESSRKAESDRKILYW